MITYIISDENPARKENLKWLQRCLGKIGKVKIVTEQPDLSSVSKLGLVYRLNFFHQLSKTSRNKSIVTTLKFLYRSMFILSDRRLIISRIVTMKHLTAVLEFYLSPYDNAIICEDDALIKHNFESLLLSSCKVANFVDLAGGMELQQPTATEKTIDGHIFYQFDRVTTNTACAYIIDKKFASEVYQHISRDPFSILLPIDWFYLSLNKHTKLTSARPLIYPIKHGSFTETEDLQSWQTIGV